MTIYLTLISPRVVHGRCRWSVSKFSSEGSGVGVNSDGFDDALQITSGGGTPKMLGGFLGNIYGNAVAGDRTNRIVP